MVTRIVIRLQCAEKLETPLTSRAAIYASLAQTRKDLREYAEAKRWFELELEARQGNPTEVSTGRVVHRGPWRRIGNNTGQLHGPSVHRRVYLFICLLMNNEQQVDNPIIAQVNHLKHMKHAYHKRQHDEHNTYGPKGINGAINDE